MWVNSSKLSVIIDSDEGLSDIGSSADVWFIGLEPLYQQKKIIDFFVKNIIIFIQGNAF